MYKWIICLLVLLCSDRIHAQQASDLDSSFAVNGKLVITGDRYVAEMIALTDEKVLLMANNQNSTEIIRLNGNGTLDSSFAVNGKLFIPSLGVRLFHRHDGHIILVSNQYPSNGSGMIQGFLPDGQVDPNFGVNGIVSDTLTDLETERFMDADLSADGRLLVCGRSAFVLPIDINGNIDLGNLIHIPDESYPCPEGQTQFITYRSHTVRFMPDGETWFLYRKQVGPCSANATSHRTFKARYDTDLTLLDTDTFFIDVYSVWHEIYQFLSPLNAPYRYLKRNMWVGTNHMYGPTEPSCVGEEPDFVSNYTDSNGVSIPYFFGSKIYGQLAVDQTGSYFAAVTLGGHFWSYRTKPYCFAPDTTWGHDGFRPPEDHYPKAGGAGSAAVQVDGKVLIGGRTSEDGLVVYRYHNIPDPRSKVNLKVFLGGPFDPSSGSMSDQLRQQSLIPFAQPYAAPAFQPKNGVGSWGLGPGVLDLEGDSAIVDWIWLELLDPDSLSLVKATRVGLLHRNGEVTASDGISPIDFSVGAGSYHLRVRHRNHLSVTTADPIALNADPITIDLTSPNTPTFGIEAQKEVNGVMVMWPGDVTANGIVKYLGPANDRDPILVGTGGSDPTAITSGYSPLDVNMDGWIKYVGSGNDRDIILQTIGGEIPIAVRSEQTP